ncbi:MAG TPA: thiamine-phosphate kinase [Nocardioidaceae bacterium]|nr:thiamine-phosphate kinase [Nocardioidaceae bacterium]
MASSQQGTVADVGEFGLIEAIQPIFHQGSDVVVGPGDDAAVLAVPAGQVVVSTDLLVEHRHFRCDWSSAEDIGHKAAAANLSDINAMGGTATGMVVGLGVPGSLPMAWVSDLARGVAEEVALTGTSVLGGDVTSSEHIVLAVTVLGACTDGPVRRSGAQPGDVVAVRGRMGWAAAGYHVLGRGFRSPRVVVEAHRRPQPPYTAGPEAAKLGATAMIDLSDGLLADLGHVARASGVSVDVRTDAFDVAEPLHAVGAALGTDPLRYVLTGGEDYALAATFSADVHLPDDWTVVGRVGDGSGVTVDGVEYDAARGYEHFR